MNNYFPSSVSFGRRPDIHGTILGLIGFTGAPMDVPEEPEVAPVKLEPEYDFGSAFAPAESCYCHIDPPCSCCVDHPEGD